MKFFFTSLFMLLLISTNAQNYEMVYSVGTAFPYNDGAAGTEIIPTHVNDVLSEWQTLPFAFNFYGNPVTGFYASDNGYITFDSEATVSFPDNTSIPDPNGPNNAIYTFWDDLELEYINSQYLIDDYIKVHTYGEAPARVHVVQWACTPIGTDYYFYIAIRLYEVGNFDVVFSRSDFSGGSGTIGCENADGTVGVQYPESPNITVAPQTAWELNDEVYTFYWQGNQYDLALESFVPENNTTLLIGDHTITGVISNQGSEQITSFDLIYTVDGGIPQSTTINAQISPNGGTYNFTHDIPWTISSGGNAYDVCVWAENLNGSFDDQNPDNDQLCHNIISATTGAVRTVLLEEFTGTWCSSCINGPVVMDQIHDLYPDDVVMVSIHDGDAMEFDDGIASGFNTPYYPSAMIDRTLRNGDEWEFRFDWEWIDVVEDHFSMYTPVEVSMWHGYDPVTREITMTLTADFVDVAAGDMRFVTMIVEDSLVGEGEGWDQKNGYNNVPGHPYYGAGNPVVGFVHNHVLRAVPSGAFGNSGIVPAEVFASESYSETITYTLPDNFNESKISMIGFLAYYGTEIGSREVLNAATMDLHEEGTVGLGEVQAVKNFKIFPNPSNELVNIMFDQATELDTKIFVYDVCGKQVDVISEKATMMEGTQHYSYNTRNLEPGLYFVTIITDDKAQTKRLVITR